MEAALTLAVFSVKPLWPIGSLLIRRAFLFCQSIIDHWQPMISVTLYRRFFVLISLLLLCFGAFSAKPNTDWWPYYEVIDNNSRVVGYIIPTTHDLRSQRFKPAPLVIDAIKNGTLHLEAYPPNVRNKPPSAKEDSRLLLNASPRVEELSVSTQDLLRSSIRAGGFSSTFPDQPFEILEAVLLRTPSILMWQILD